MSLDKSWVKIEKRACAEYYNGVDEFLDFAFRNVKNSDNKIRCPCVDCNNMVWKSREEVESDLVRIGIDKSYTLWYCHGEKIGGSLLQEDDDDGDEEEERDDMHNLIMDTYGYGLGATSVPDESNPNEAEKPNEDADKFYRLLKEAEEELYPGCNKYSRLSFVIKLLHIKCLNGWSNKSLTMLLEFLKDAFSQGESLPNSYYEAKKVTKDLGLDYIKIDACENDCVLYWKEHESATQCPVCGLSRWKNGGEDGKRKKIPCKILRYFPIKSRLQRLYMSSKTAEYMRWHHDERDKDGVIRHPADAKEWKDFDLTHEAFAAEPRNVRLGVASDGFNPFGNMSVSYSIWPVVVVPYNLPPWMCMKQPYIFMSLLIPGPKSPGNDIDVYLRPLIDDLKDLWEFGVNTYDASKEQNFMMRAALMWTINDFPAYANLSGWSTKGYLACPCCATKDSSEHLTYGGKMCYTGHRKFLPHDHKWRDQTEQFNNKKETRAAPIRLTGDDVLNQLRDHEQVTFGKTTQQKLQHFGSTHNWTKRSIFFELPYWRTLKLRHNLDVMHIEKNVCDSIVWTLMSMEKSKDNLKSRLDLQEMNIRNSLHPKVMNGRVLLPRACYAFTKDERRTICKWLKDLKVPDGYCANISKCAKVKEGKISGMKSHDNHVFLERLLPLAIRDLLPRHVCDALIEISIFFRDLCSKTFRADDIERFEQKIAVTLCKLERIFPPSFFDVMEHLPIHLPWEAKLGGPVQYRWMYPIERYLGTLKSYVRNRARPEGSIAEGYLSEECLTFCSMYLHGVETRFNRPERNYDGGVVKNVGLSVFSHSGRAFGKSSMHFLSNDEYMAARLYVLENCENVASYIEEHKNMLRQENVRNVDEMHKKGFVRWFEQRVTQLYNDSSNEVDEQMLSLARGPDMRVTCYSAYNTNGFKFCTKDREVNKKTQNSGVVVRGNFKENEVDYYGELLDVFELHYTEGNKVVLFKCNWWDVTHIGSGMKVDRYGITSVNTSRKLKTTDHFVLASQAKQVFYVKGIKDPVWNVVVKTTPRNLYDMSLDQANNLQDDAYQEDLPQAHVHEENSTNEHISWNRMGGQTIDENVLLQEKEKRKKINIRIDQDTSNDGIDDEMLDAD